eukprot:scaffold45160_cov70-Phaeocystis_antarctica.AAC.2
MRANAKPAAAPGDGSALGPKTPALIKKMSNQQTKPGGAMPVRAHHGCRAVPQASACTDNRAKSLSSGSRGPTAPLTSPRKQRCKPGMRW